MPETVTTGIKTDQSGNIMVGTAEIAASTSGDPLDPSRALQARFDALVLYLLDQGFRPPESVIAGMDC